MYKTYFELKREPFSVAADPRFLYLSPEHRKAAQHLLFGLQSGAGFILLTGDVGAGKSMVCRAFLRLLPASTDVANIVNPRVDFNGLLLKICEDLRIEVPPACPDLIDAIHGHLLLARAAGRRTLIVVDEAQALSHEVLELLRLLTNLDSTGRKLQIFLIGQPELRATLQLPALQPVSQRIVARFHLTALPEAETPRYIAHRLKVAGLEGPLPFDASAIAAIHEACAGIPRRINVLCDRALLTARNMGIRTINGALIEQIVPSVFDERPVTQRVVQPSPQGLTARAAQDPSSPAGALRVRRRVLALATCGAVISGILLIAELLDSPRKTPAAETPSVARLTFHRSGTLTPGQPVAVESNDADVLAIPTAPAAPLASAAARHSSQAAPDLNAKGQSVPLAPEQDTFE